MISDNIQFFSEDISFELEDKTSILTWLLWVLNQQAKELRQLNYIFTSDKYLHQMNLSFLDHDTFTDVISFPYSNEQIEGDIFISVERVKENALELGDSFETELKRVMVHGLLHFLGFKDKSEEEKIAMRKKEDEYLQYFSL